MEKTKAGNEIIRGFSFAGCCGTEYNLMGKLAKKGFRLFFCEAPYFWEMINFKTKEIFTYCEGDTTLIRCKTKKGLIEEIKNEIEFYNDDEEKIQEIIYCLEKNNFIIPELIENINIEEVV